MDEKVTALCESFITNREIIKKVFKDESDEGAQGVQKAHQEELRRALLPQGSGDDALRREPLDEGGSEGAL